MSLINKMLQDLDARGTPVGQSLPSHVMPVAHERRLPSLRLAAIGAGVAAVCVAGLALAWFGWRQLHALRPAQTVAASVASKPTAITPAQGLQGRITPAPAAAGAPLAKVAPPGAVAAPSQLAAPAPARAGLPEQPSRQPAERDEDAGAEVARPAAARHDAAAHADARHADARTSQRAGAHVGAHPSEDAGASAADIGSKSVLPTEPDSQDARQARHAAAIELSTREARMARLARLSARQTQAEGALAGSKGKAEAPGRQEAPAQRAEDAYRRALASLQDGRMLDAIGALQQALRADPGHEAARQTLVGLLVESGRSDDAIRELQLGLAQDARQPALAMLLARLQIERGGSGIETLLRTLPYAGNNTVESAEYHGFLAGALQRQQRHREAAEQYQQALRSAPGNGVWWMGLGLSLQADKRNAEALDAFQRARASGSLNADLQTFVERHIQQLAH